MAGVNKVILVGNAGDDPQVRQMPGGGSVVNLSIATSESWNDKATGEKRERTEWHKIVFFNNQANFVAKAVKKGDKVYVEGSIRTNKWQDQNGQDRFTTEIVCKVVEIMSQIKKNDAEPRLSSSADRQQAEQEEFEDVPF
jgi:single-strand DNA-binding protein